MDKQDILNMAREAGFPFNKYGLLAGDEDGEIDADEMFERFAALVAAAAKAEEREAILAIAASEEFNRMYGEFSPSAYDLATAIRARQSL